MNFLKIIILFLFVLTPMAKATEPNIQNSNAAHTNNLSIKSTNVEQASSGIPQTISIVKDIANIAFFIIMATIAVLSYGQAKKTVFSPIKTETFKYQLESFESVIKHFQNKNQHDLISDMDINKIIEINSFILFSDYIETFLKEEVEINHEAAKELMNLAKGAIVSKEYAAEYFEVIGIDDKQVVKKEQPNDPALRLAGWNSRKQGMVHFTEKYSNAINDIKQFQSSPLLPSQLKKLLAEYADLMHETLSALNKTLEEAGNKMPTVYVGKESTKKFNHNWIYNLNNARTPNLEPKANEILDFINVYLGVDELAKTNV